VDYILGKDLLCGAGKEIRNTRLPDNELKRRDNAYICTVYSRPDLEMWTSQVHSNSTLHSSFV
jgi:hypothetical protein